MSLRLVRPLGGLAMVAGVIGACVIAEPPTDPVTLPALRPTILRGSAVPQPTAVLTRWPDKGFLVPVQLSDPRLTFYATDFVDYNPATGEGYDNNLRSAPGVGATETVRNLTFQIPEPTNDRCHVVEILVALEFNSVNDGRNAHTPRTPGGADSITWFYSPSGDFAGCPVLDAGLTPLDAGVDGAIP